MPSWLLIRFPLFTSWHRHISPWKICLWVQAEFLAQFQRGPHTAAGSAQEKPCLPPAAGPARGLRTEGLLVRWPSHSDRPFPPHHRHRARQRCASGYAQNTQVQQKHGRQWHRARDLKLSKTYWGLCLIRRKSSFAILSTSKFSTKK